MMKGACKNVIEAIGNTPIVKLNKVVTKVDSEIFVKMEMTNPGGSIKERIGAYILDKAREEGKLLPGGTIIEGTSGNTGVGLAMYAAVHGHKCIFVLADKQSQEKIQNLRAFGAKVVVCPTNVEPEDPRSYYSVSKKLAESIPNSFFVGQYNNPYNPDTHYHTTGPEIWNQTQGDMDAFVAGVGTGGTVSGTGKFLKEKDPNIRVVAVDCEGSILATYAKSGEMIPAESYVLEGIGEDFIPDNINFKTIDEWVTVGDRESFLMTRELLTKEGIYTGGSGGAAVVGAIKYAQTLDKPQKILVILPDSGNRYASKIFNDDWMRENGYVDSSFNVTVKEVLETIDAKESELYFLDEKSSIQEAIDLFDKHQISQIPIKDEGKIVGIVTEKEILRPVFEGKLSTQDRLAIVKQNTFKIVNHHCLLNEVTDSLALGHTVLVQSGERVTSILTNNDILKFMTKAQMK
jgi:cystathionine beta-synthase